MTTHSWTKLAVLILIAGVVLASGNALSRDKGQESPAAKDLNEVENLDKHTTPKVNPEGEKPANSDSGTDAEATEPGDDSDSSQDSDAAAKPKNSTPKPKAESTPAADDSKHTRCSNGTSGNHTDCSAGAGGLLGTFTENKEMLTRTFYVLIGVTSIIVVYFVVRAVRIRRRQNRTKRYGVISTNDDRMEMTPLDQDDDDDEDLTVFEANGRLIK